MRVTKRDVGIFIAALLLGGGGGVAVKASPLPPGKLGIRQLLVHIHEDLVAILEALDTEHVHDPVEPDC